MPLSAAPVLPMRVQLSMTFAGDVESHTMSSVQNQVKCNSRKFLESVILCRSMILIAMQFHKGMTNNCAMPLINFYRCDWRTLLHISRFRDFTRPDDVTSYRSFNRGLGIYEAWLIHSTINKDTIGSDNALSPVRHQSIT